MLQTDTPGPTRAEAEAPTPWAIEARGLVKRYGPNRALAGVDLVVGWEERVALLGANGAGKTTLLRMLATLIRPDAGLIAIGGLLLPKDAAAVRRHLGFVAHQTFLHDELTARENLRFYGRLYGVPNLERRIDALLDRVGLAPRGDARVRTLSRGLQQRLTLARAIVHDPPILLLDEPETGLDVAVQDVLGTLLTDENGRRRSVVLTSHNVDRAVGQSDRAVVLARGRVTLDAPTDEVDGEVIRAAIRDGAAPGGALAAR